MFYVKQTLLVTLLSSVQSVTLKHENRHDDIALIGVVVDINEIMFGRLFGDFTSRLQCSKCSHLTRRIMMMVFCSIVHLHNLLWRLNYQHVFYNTWARREIKLPLKLTWLRKYFSVRHTIHKSDVEYCKNKNYIRDVILRHIWISQSKQFCVEHLSFS